MGCLLQDSYCEIPIAEDHVGPSVQIADFGAYDDDLVQTLGADLGTESPKALIVRAGENEHPLADGWKGPVGPSSGARFELGQRKLHKRRDLVHVSHSIYAHVDDEAMMTSDLLIICIRMVIVSRLFTPSGSPGRSWGG